MNFHEVIRRRVFPVNRRHVRVADSGKSTVRRLDLLYRSTCLYTEDLVERRRRDRVQVQIRSSWLFCPCRASFSGGSCASGYEYWPRSDAARRWSYGGVNTGEVCGVERRRKRYYRRNHDCNSFVKMRCRYEKLRFGNEE